MRSCIEYVCEKAGFLVKLNETITLPHQSMTNWENSVIGAMVGEPDVIVRFLLPPTSFLMLVSVSMAASAVVVVVAFKIPRDLE